MTSRPTAFSLFAGAGGLDLGVEEAGYDVVDAIDNDAAAMETLNRNRERWFPSMPLVQPLDITELDLARSCGSGG